MKGLTNHRRVLHFAVTGALLGAAGCASKDPATADAKPETKEPPVKMVNPGIEEPTTAVKPEPELPEPEPEEHVNEGPEPEPAKPEPVPLDGPEEDVAVNEGPAPEPVPVPVPVPEPKGAAKPKPVIINPGPQG